MIEEWKRCLIESYIITVRDNHNVDGMTKIMLEADFSLDELEELKHTALGIHSDMNVSEFSEVQKEIDKCVH